MGNDLSAIRYENARNSGVSPEYYEKVAYANIDLDSINLQSIVKSKGIGNITKVTDKGICGADRVVPWSNLGDSDVTNAYIHGFQEGLKGNHQQNSWSLLPRAWKKGNRDSEEYIQN